MRGRFLPTVPMRWFAFASRLTTGGLRPPLLCCSANVCRRNNDFCDAQTYIRPRAAGVSPPWFGKRASADTSTIRRQTADGVCADRRCGRVYGRHGANVAPESYMRHTAPDYNRVHRRHGGLTPPALVLRCERLPTKQRFLRCTNVHSTKSGGRQPAVAVREAYLQERCRKVAGDCRHYAHERWCSRVRLPRLAYASRSWLHDVRSLRNA
jgi:hypothetical protein